jgi:hypothetical protein
MTRFRQKAEAQAMRIIGQMIGDDRLVQEGREEERRTETENEQQRPSLRDQPRQTRRNKGANS